MRNGFLSISVGITVLSILSGSIIWVYSTIDRKVEPVEVKAQQALVETVKLGEAIITIKDDTRIIKEDIKKLLSK